MRIEKPKIPGIAVITGKFPSYRLEEIGFIKKYIFLKRNPKTLPQNQLLSISPIISLREDDLKAINKNLKGEENG